MGAPLFQFATPIVAMYWESDQAMSAQKALFHRLVGP
jgi:hypothetical protein